jgi:hypothetical protein
MFFEVSRSLPLDSLCHCFVPPLLVTQRAVLS